MKPRKKPMTIKGFQYDGDLKGSDGVYYVPDWAVEAFESGVMYFRSALGSPSELFVETSEEICHVNVGDYVIRGIKGELSVCESDKFDKTYEIIE